MTEDPHLPQDPLPWSPLAQDVPTAVVPANVPGAEVPGDGGHVSRPEAATRRRRRWPWVLLVAFALAVAVSSRIDLNYYALRPGTAQSVQQFITVPADKAHVVVHPVLLTDVEIGRVTALSYLFFKAQSDTTFEEVASVTGGTRVSELGAQGTLEMSQAETYAKVAALRRLGYSVPATPAGAVIFGTFAGTPAAGVLDVGDVVTAVDGVATASAQALTHQLAKYHSGQLVTLSVRRGGTAAPAPIVVRLRSTVINLGYGPGGKGPYAHVTLGIEPEDQVDYTFPFPVSINVKDIGGPSAGLAMTLGVIDTLDKGTLTGRRTVAATGTMDAEGDVGDVGGVAQKTVAVENAGASIFLVPPEEYKAAMSEDRPSLKIFAVSTLGQALAVLATHGGSVPPTTVTTTSTVPPG